LKEYGAGNGLPLFQKEIEKGKGVLPGLPGGKGIVAGSIVAEKAVIGVGNHDRGEIFCFRPPSIQPP
jgi:hypothetical protein